MDGVTENAEGILAQFSQFGFGALIAGVLLIAFLAFVWKYMDSTIKNNIKINEGWQSAQKEISQKFAETVDNVSERYANDLKENRQQSRQDAEDNRRFITDMMDRINK